MAIELCFVYKMKTAHESSAAAAVERPGVHYKGVRMRKWGRWVAEVRLPNSRQRIWLGSYATAEAAARAFDAAVFCLRGPSASFNFPETPPNIPSAGGLTAEQIREAAMRYAHEWTRGTGHEEDTAQASAATPRESGGEEFPSSHEDVLELLRRLPLEHEQPPLWDGNPGLLAEDDDGEMDCGGWDDTLWSYAMDERPEGHH